MSGETIGVAVRVFAIGWLLYTAYQFAGKVVGNALAYYITKQETGRQDGASANRSFYSIFVVIGASAVAGYLVGRPW